MAHDTKTNALWNEHRLAREKMDAELQKVCEAEFPPGTPVKWIYSFERGTNNPIWRRGKVVRVGSYCRVTCRMDGKTADHEKYGHELEHDRPAS
jgi:hypothetical protein